MTILHFDVNEVQISFRRKEALNNSLIGPQLATQQEVHHVHIRQAITYTTIKTQKKILSAHPLFRGSALPRLAQMVTAAPSEHHHDSLGRPWGRPQRATTMPVSYLKV